MVALELAESPHLVGDGNARPTLPLDKAAAMPAWQSLNGASIPAAGQKILMDFKYATQFDAPVFENRNVWLTQDEAVRHQFAKAAALLGNCVPLQLRRRQLFTLDAVVDEQ